MKKHKIHVMPGGITRVSAKGGLVVAGLFLLFGLGFGGVVLSEMPDSEVGLKILISAFFCIWLAVCITLIVVFLRFLMQPATEEAVSLADLHVTESDDDSTTVSPDFDDRLRKLVQLKRDGLITDVEFENKREQLLDERW